MPEWTIGPVDAGVRLDKFLAGADRIGSRARAADALHRGKIFLNDRQATIVDAGMPLAPGDVAQQIELKPASKKRDNATALSPLNI